jgi:hypothetical protein
MFAKCISGWAVSGCMLLLSGCSWGPVVIRENLLRYNAATSATENEQFLLNLVRLRYRDPPKTIALNAINSQFNFEEDPSASVSLPSYFQRAFRGGNPPSFMASTINPVFSTLLFALAGRVSDTPTISMTPQTGADFTKGLVAPIPLERIVLLANTGWDLDRLLRIMVYNMNGLENAPHVAGQGGERIPRFMEFVAVAGTLGRLQHEEVLELASNPDPVLGASYSQPFRIKASKGDGQEAGKEEENGASSKTAKREEGLSPTDVIKAADSHFILHEQNDGKYILKGILRAYDLNLAPEAWADPELPLAAHSLRLIPGQPTYRMVPGEGGQFMRLRQGEGTDIVVSTRSIISALVYLSKGVEVPSQHVMEGLVREPVDAEGRSFDWTQVTDGVFRVQVQKTKPKCAFVCVHYRGYWYYIADDDLTSKSSFDLMLEMFDVQIAPGIAAAPILTLSVGAPP